MKLFPFLALGAFVPTLPAADWPQYLGPRGDATSSEKINGDWSKKPPRTLWKTQVGKGCGSWAIVEGKALVTGNDGRNDIVRCLNAQTGKSIWRHQYPEKLVPNLYEGGPNTTPTVDGNLVYTLSKSGVLFCLNLADGRPVWRKHLKTDFGGKAGGWGFTASPVVDGNLVYVLPCSKTEPFMPSTRKVERSPGTPPTSSVPVTQRPSSPRSTAQKQHSCSTAAPSSLMT